MSDATSDAFLQGQGIPVDLREISNTLEHLWGPAAEQFGGPEIDHPNLTRIVLANLVVESLTGECSDLRPILETVITRFPCRAIVFRGSDSPDRKITAEVSAMCHLPDPGMPQVCSERIVLHASQNALEMIPGAVRPLLEADLPYVLWWTTDPSRHEALFRNLADECSRLIVDLPDPGSSATALSLGLDPSVAPCSRDSAWFGLTRWRELVAQFFDCSTHVEALNRIDSFKIEAFSPDHSHPPRLAIWLASWFAGQLGWKPSKEPVNSTGDAESTFRAEFQGPIGTPTIEILTKALPKTLPAAPRLNGVSITAQGPNGTESFRLNRPFPDSADVLIKADSPHFCRLPSLVLAPELDPARRIAAALESSRTDPPYLKALPIALWMIRQSEA
jgi:hypothetical protein